MAQKGDSPALARAAFEGFAAKGKFKGNFRNLRTLVSSSVGPGALGDGRRMKADVTEHLVEASSRTALSDHITLTVGGRAWSPPTSRRDHRGARGSLAVRGAVLRCSVRRRDISGNTAHPRGWAVSRATGQLCPGRGPPGHRLPRRAALSCRNLGRARRPTNERGAQDGPAGGAAAGTDRHGVGLLRGTGVPSDLSRKDSAFTKCKRGKL